MHAARVAAVRRLVAQLLKYGAASAVALGVDYGLMVALTELAGLHYLVSALIGFCCGAVVAYVLSVAFVFTERRLSNPALEFGLFVLIGLAALGLNQGLMYALVDGAGVHYALAKVPVTGVVFLCNFALRKALLFSTAARTAAA